MKPSFSKRASLSYQIQAKSQEIFSVWVAEVEDWILSTLNLPALDHDATDLFEFLKDGKVLLGVNLKWKNVDCHFQVLGNLMNCINPKFSIAATKSMSEGRGATAFRSR